MKRALIAAAIILATVPVYAGPPSLSPAEIAALPQDAVNSIRQSCAASWGHDYDMRLYCENKQYDALRQYVERSKAIAPVYTNHEGARVAGDVFVYHQNCKQLPPSFLQRALDIQAPIAAEDMAIAKGERMAVYQNDNGGYCAAVKSKLRLP